MSNTVCFYLNGQPVTLNNPPPDLLLIDYLRSPDVSLSGAKKGCGQGGCGACTVILSHWDKERNEPEHRSINSCLRAVCSLQGLSVTTIEGTSAVRRLPPAHPKHSLAASRGGAPFNARGSQNLLDAQTTIQTIRLKAIDEGRGDRAGQLLKGVSLAELPEIDTRINPVAYRLAVNNGSQCGYCSTGFVMNMSAFLANHPDPTKKQIEEAFDGNICRCTGYRPILTAMKTFAVDWNESDEANRMKCLFDDQVKAQKVGNQVVIPFPEGARKGEKEISVQGEHQQWYAPQTIDELLVLYQSCRGSLYMIHANTAFGVYPEDFNTSEHLVNISGIPELYQLEQQGHYLLIGGGTTYSQLLAFLDQQITENQLSQTSPLGALQFMVHRTAGTIVRNAATLAGNSMLVLKHIAEGTGEPFPSDVFTVLSALDVNVSYINLNDGSHIQSTINDLINNVIKYPELADQLLLLSYEISLSENAGCVLAQKVALRDINAHSIVNSTSIINLSRDYSVNEVNLTFGAIAPYPWRASKTEALIKNAPLLLDDFSIIATTLAAEVQDELSRWKERMAGLPDEGFTDQYKVELAVSFVYKAVVNALLQVDSITVPQDIQSSGEITWGHWPVSDGSQYYSNQSYKKPVSQPYVKLMSLYQTSGQVRYTHEMEVPPTTVHGAFVQSQRALADFCFKSPFDHSYPVSIELLLEQLKKEFPELIQLVTCDNVPEGGVNTIGMGGDQPVFAEKRVSYVGQSIALAVASSEKHADQIADFITHHCIHYETVSWPSGHQWGDEWNEPVLNLEEAIERGSIYPDCPASASFYSHIWRITRHHSDFHWLTAGKQPLDKSIVTRQAMIDGGSCKVVENNQATGGQVHFYMETQACVALPGEAERLIMHPSSQSPMEMHQTVATVLGVEQHQLEVCVRQVGGGYGGKTEQAKFVIGAAAVAAKTLNKPLRLVMPRESDTHMIGKRHPYYGQYQIAIDDGGNNPDHKGIIRGMDFNFYGDGGAFYDCSYIVSNCLQMRVDNAYMTRNFRTTLDVYRTNTAPNTAFRSFGDIQGKLVSENAIDDAAFAIGMNPEAVREKNLYQRGDVTPFGQALSYCYIREVWQYLKEKSDIDNRKQAVEAFNRKNRWRKRGIYMLPVKYGSGYNLVQLEQASALVSVIAGDGSVIINQGGVDMGQGMVTKVEQIAAYILNIPMDMIRIELPKTAVIPNPTSTGGSTGTAYNGLAVKQTCEKLRSRLTEFGYSMLKEKGDDWCKEAGIDFWNYGTEGWSATVTIYGSKTLIWQNLISLAYSQRISLVEAFNAEVPGGETPVPHMEFKPESQQKPLPGIDLAEHPIPGGFDSFCGFTYSAACSEVEVDILTGEVKIIRSDIMYDMGWSINPALDIGQVEGAFIQGVGYIMTEKLVFEPDGGEQGRLNTVNTWRYKPPAITNVPLEMNVHLFPRDKAEHVPDNPNELMSAKEVGEPPLVLATSVFFAIKAAIRDSRVERGLNGLFKLDAPATVQEVRRACEVDFSKT